MDLKHLPLWISTSLFQTSSLIEPVLTDWLDQLEEEPPGSAQLCSLT